MRDRARNGTTGRRRGQPQGRGSQVLVSLEGVPRHPHRARPAKGGNGNGYENVFTTESITMYRAGSNHMGGAGSDDVGGDSAEDDGRDDEDDIDTDVEDDDMSCTEDQRSPPPPMAW